MVLDVIYRAPRTSVPHPGHGVCPYLLWGLTIKRLDRVCCADIAYIPVSRGFLYLVAIMGWASRYVVAWRLSKPRRPACGYDGQAAVRLVHIPTSAAAAGRSAPGNDRGGMPWQRSTPTPM